MSMVHGYIIDSSCGPAGRTYYTPTPLERRISLKVNFVRASTIGGVGLRVVSDGACCYRDYCRTWHGTIGGLLLVAFIPGG